MKKDSVYTWCYYYKCYCEYGRVPIIQSGINDVWLCNLDHNWRIDGTKSAIPPYNCPLNCTKKD